MYMLYIYMCVCYIYIIFVDAKPIHKLSNKSI